MRQVQTCKGGGAARKGESAGIAREGARGHGDTGARAMRKNARRSECSDERRARGSEARRFGGLGYQRESHSFIVTERRWQVAGPGGRWRGDAERAWEFQITRG